MSSLTMRIIWIMILVFSSVTGAPSETNTPDDSKLEDIYGDLVDTNTDVQNDHTSNTDVQNDFDKDEYDVDDLEESEEEVNLKTSKRPELVTTDRDILADPNSTVVLPCEIKDLGNYVFVWKKENDMLYQLDIRVTPSKNIVMTTPNNSLIIKKLSPSDVGNYSCSILITETDRPTVYHSVQIKQPPQIYNLTLKAETKIIQPGDSIELNCQASGLPKPKITWHFRKVGTQYNEKLGTEGSSIRIEGMTHRNSGKYQCMADNKVGVATEEIEVHVHHKPSLIIEKIINNSEKGKDIELKCTVHAMPRAVVNWQKDGSNIARSPDVSMETHEHDHILIIKNLKDSDFGTYTCQATNGVGSSAKNVSIVKTPAILDFIKPEIGHKDALLKWKVESKSPISNHEIEYRKEGEPKWRTSRPIVKSSDNDIYIIEYKIDGLDAGKYEARARSQNSYGWSEFSDVMKFEGVYAKKGQHHKQHKKSHKESKEKHTSAPQDIPAQKTENDIHNETGVGASVSGSSTISANMFSLVSILLILLWHRQ